MSEITDVYYPPGRSFPKKYRYKMSDSDIAKNNPVAEKNLEVDNAARILASFPEELGGCSCNSNYSEQRRLELLNIITTREKLIEKYKASL